MASTNRKHGLMKSAMLLTMVSAFSLVFSFVQEAVFAKFFGTSMYSDAYAISIQIPVVLFAVISTAIQTVVVPLYSKIYYNQGKKIADDFASNLLTIVSGITIIIVIICEFFADGLIYLFAPGLLPEVHDLAVQLSRIVLPTMIMTEMLTINSGIMNVYKSYILPALASNILNIIFVVSVVLLSSKYSIYAAAYGYLFGIITELMYSIVIRRRYYKYSFKMELKEPQMTSALKMSIPVFIGIGAAEINKVVDKIVSSFLVAGSISSLNYASKLTSAISSLLITSISTVVYPQFAKQASKNDKEGLTETFRMTLVAYLLIIVPLIFGGIYLQNEIISIVFKRGEFDVASVNTTAPLFACYLICLLFTAFRQASSRVFYSLEDSKTPMKNSLIGIAINIVLNICLAKFFGALGLALATTISTAIISFLIMKEVKHKLLNLNYKSIFIIALKCVVSSTIMIIIMRITEQLVYPLMKQITNDFLQLIIYLLIMISVGGITYLIGLIVTRTKEIQIVINMIKRRK